jgi:hypothetical protein
VEPSIFLDFHLPNAATWFYFSLFLTVALFFQFARPYSLRNLDLLLLFLLAPGFLLLQEAHSSGSVGEGESATRAVLISYSWLLAGSGCLFARAIFDLTLVRRPTVSPNLTPAGLVCVGVALFVGLTSVGLRRTAEEQIHVGRKPAPIEQVEDQAAHVVQQAQNGSGRFSSPDDVRFWVERGLARPATPRSSSAS